MRALTGFQAKVLADVAAHEPTSCAEVAQRLGQRNTGQTRVALGSLRRLGLIEEFEHRAWRCTPKGAGWTQPRHTSAEEWLAEGMAAGWASPTYCGTSAERASILTNDDDHDLLDACTICVRVFTDGTTWKD